MPLPSACTRIKIRARRWDEPSLFASLISLASSVLSFSCDKKHVRRAKASSVMLIFLYISAPPGQEHPTNTLVQYLYTTFFYLGRRTKRVFMYACREHGVLDGALTGSHFNKNTDNKDVFSRRTKLYRI